MAATGALADAIDRVVTVLEAAGFRVCTDPRALAPRSVMVQLPRFTAFNGNVVEVTVDLQVVAGASNDVGTFDWLLTSADEIHAAGLAILSGEPVTLLVGQQELPAYQFTVNIAHTRTP